MIDRFRRMLASLKATIDGKPLYKLSGTIMFDALRSQQNDDTATPN
jgi:hypothetical protein